MSQKDWSIRRADPADLAAIIAIERECASAPHWSEAAWSDLSAEKDASDPERVVFLAEGSGSVLGFVVVSRSRDVAELESVAVVQASHRRGIGRALCEEAMAWSRTRLAETIELEVRASSAGALALYRSLGFIEQGRRRSYYRDPVEDALILFARL